MKDDLHGELIKLERVVAAMEKAAKLSLGFVKRIEHGGVSFDVSSRFVIADLSPLAFFDLVEQIDADGAAAAVTRLYERVTPLLSCTHKWTALRRHSDLPTLRMAQAWLASGDRVHVCKACTAYVLGGSKTSLPVVGRVLPAQK